MHPSPSQALLAEPYSEAGLKAGFKFAPDVAADGSGVYVQPEAESHDEYLQVIRNE